MDPYRRESSAERDALLAWDERHAEGGGVDTTLEADYLSGFGEPLDGDESALLERVELAKERERLLAAVAFEDLAAVTKRVARSFRTMRRMPEHAVGSAMCTEEEFEAAGEWHDDPHEGPPGDGCLTPSGLCYPADVYAPDDDDEGGGAVASVEPSPGTAEPSRFVRRVRGASAQARQGSLGTAIRETALSDHDAAPCGSE